MYLWDQAWETVIRLENNATVYGITASTYWDQSNIAILIQETCTTENMFLISLNL